MSAPERNQLLGIDIGTSSVKGTVIDGDGRLLTQAAAAHDLHSPHPGWAEQDPADWWRNTVAVIQKCLAHPAVDAARIAAVGCTGMLPAVLLLDGAGRVLRPSIQQNDARATAQIAAMQDAAPPDFYFQRTGAALSQQSVGPKLLWLQEHEPEIWRQTRTILGSYDYINYRLTGALNIEANWALESGLYDIQTRDWSADLLVRSGVTAALLPPVQSPETVIGGVTTAVAAATGLRAGTPVVAGTADHVGAAFAAGIVEDGDLLIKFGSAGDILYCCDELLLERRLYIDYHNIPGKYLLNGCMATSGSFIKWLAREFYHRGCRKSGGARSIGLCVPGCSRRRRCRRAAKG
jgi:xylulokinase